MSLIHKFIRYWFPCIAQRDFEQYENEYMNKPIPVKKEGNRDSDLEEFDFEKSSDIKVTYRIGKIKCNQYYATILVVSYSGNYKIGGAGNGDAVSMMAKRDFGLTMTGASAVIIDFRELNYVWGDMIESVIYFSHNCVNPIVACVLGEGCREAIGTLVHDDVNSKQPATTEEFIFDEFDEAWQYIEEQLKKK
jgi:hypothetical protein